MPAARARALPACCARTSAAARVTRLQACLRPFTYRAPRRAAVRRAVRRSRFGRQSADSEERVRAQRAHRRALRDATRSLGLFVSALHADVQRRSGAVGSAAKVAEASRRLHERVMHVREAIDAHTALHDLAGDNDVVAATTEVRKAQALLTDLQALLQPARRAEERRTFKTHIQRKLQDGDFNRWCGAHARRRRARRRARGGSPVTRSRSARARARARASGHLPPARARVRAGLKASTTLCTTRTSC